MLPEASPVAVVTDVVVVVVVDAAVVAVATGASAEP